MSVAPFVSIVVPTHGRRAMLERLIGSLRRQTHPADRTEIIVVHNWTDDGTEPFLRALEAGGEKPRLAYHRKNFDGPAASRQFGAGAAAGEIIAFIDDDCEAAPGWIAAGAAAMAPGIGVVQGRTLPRPDQKRRYLEKTVCVEHATPFFETCNIFYRKQAFDAVGGFSAEFLGRFFGEDTDLGCKVMEAGWGRAFSPAALVHHEVFAQPLLAWHKEVLHLRVWPLLVRKWPKLRRELYGGYFLTRQSAAFALAALGLVAAPVVHPASLVLAAPYVLAKSMDAGRFSNPLLAAARIVVGLPRAALILAALVYGSVRYRSLVL